MDYQSFVVASQDVDVVHAPVMSQDEEILNSLVQTFEIHIVVLTEDVLKEDLWIDGLVEALLLYLYDLLNGLLLFRVRVAHVFDALLKLANLFDLDLLLVHDLGGWLIEGALDVVNDLIQLRMVHVGDGNYLKKRLDSSQYFEGVRSQLVDSVSASTDTASLS